MPCYDSRPSEDLERFYALEKAFGRNDELARMLCAVCQRVDQSTIESVPNLADWWRQHQEDDKRRAEEAAKWEAEKSTPYRLPSGYLEWPRRHRNPWLPVTED